MRPMLLLLREHSAARIGGKPEERIVMLAPEIDAHAQVVPLLFHLQRRQRAEIVRPLVIVEDKGVLERSAHIVRTIEVVAGRDRQQPVARKGVRPMEPDLDLEKDDLGGFQSLEKVCVQWNPPRSSFSRSRSRIPDDSRSKSLGTW